MIPKVPALSRLALACATGLTVFVLAIAGGVVVPLLAHSTSSAEPAAAVIADQPAAEPMPDLAAVLAQREAAYKDALAQAQQELDKAAQQRAALEEENARVRAAYLDAAAQAREQAQQLTHQQILFQAAALAPVLAPAAPILPPILPQPAAAAPAPALVEPQRQTTAPEPPTAPASGSAQQPAQQPARTPAVPAVQPALPPQLPQAAQAAPTAQALISREQAIQLARSATGGGAAREVELKRERGGLAYEIQLEGDAKAVIDATSGRVLSAQPARRQSSNKESEKRSRRENKGRDD